MKCKNFLVLIFLYSIMNLTACSSAAKTNSENQKEEIKSQDQLTESQNKQSPLQVNKTKTILETLKGIFYLVNKAILFDGNGNAVLYDIKNFDNPITLQEPRVMYSKEGENSLAILEFKILKITNSDSYEKIIWFTVIPFGDDYIADVGFYFIENCFDKMGEGSLNIMFAVPREEYVESVDSLKNEIIFTNKAFVPMLKSIFEDAQSKIIQAKKTGKYFYFTDIPTGFTIFESDATQVDRNRLSNNVPKAEAVSIL